MIADMISNKKLNPVVTELFIRGRKLNFSLIFVMQSYFAVSKDIRLNSTHYSITEIQNKRKFQQIAINHLSGLEFNNFMKIYKKYTAKTIFYIHKKNPLHFRKNNSERIYNKSWQWKKILKIKNYSMILIEKLSKIIIVIIRQN